MAEIELAVFTRQCLNRRMADIDTLRQQAHAWAQRRNADQIGIDWQFIDEQARTKLKSLLDYA